MTIRFDYSAPNCSGQATICPCCDSPRILDSWSVKRLQKEVLWCGSCGFGWLHPAPTNEELRKHCEMSLPHRPSNDEEKGVGFARRIQQINNLTGKRGRLLDVGSGMGHFLNAARRHGWQVTGVEPQMKAASYCVKNWGIEPYRGFIEDFGFDPGSFDVVTLWDVWEHVYDPLRLLDHCIDLVSPGGLLALAIPNASGWPARLFRGNWRYVMSIHLNYFTLPFVNSVLTAKELKIETVCHTLKLHSLIQSMCSALSIGLNIEKFMKVGCEVSDHSEGRDFHEISGSAQRVFTKKNLLAFMRAVVLKMNLARLPLPVGDLMDIYCRKI